VIDDDPVPPSRLVPRVARDLETICLKCLSKEPHKRYSSASELADDLGHYLSGEPIEARRTGLWERGVKWARRRPVAATFMFLATAAAMGLVVALVALDRDRRDQVLRTAMKRISSDGVIYQAKADLDHNDPDSARTRLLELRSELRTRIQGEPDLRAPYKTADDLLAQIERRRAEDRMRGQDHARSLEFFRRRNEALFHETQFTGLGGPANRAATRKSALAALVVRH
jgi:eukaryotic-like serine/threonine-protein kinase